MVSDDQEHVDQVLAGDANAFENLVRKYHRLGGAIAFGIVGEFSLAEDVVQDAFLRAYRSLESLRKPELFRPWFSGIVRKRAIDVLRQQMTRRRVTRDVDEIRETAAAEQLGPDDRFLREEQRQKILEAVSELPEDDRLVVVLKHMEGCSYKEISEITGSSVSAVESRLFRARQALRQRLMHRINL